ncbi:zinc ribbon domain-containing protein [Psychromonas antarctica]|uniref:zinc ribbon domain-containing protein n=1 Tax=Psychromonas antarctica TaxID=67573 RepID=UPI001EE8BF35|nr:zinc ribbon domain-containing protein [Psychromonas antarctica]MCG6200322.1 zinc ribbon domain-containing protein [Psychromonas antarctica]
MELTCPKCQNEIEYGGIQKQNYHCDACAGDFKLHAACDKCGDKLELLQACGAANLWCNSCNELKSKSTAIYTLQPL